jgi:hypothetical protein
MPAPISEAECIEVLQAAAEELGRPPRRKEFIEDFDGPSHSPLRRHFGSWNQALEAAGLEPGTHSFTEAELATAIRAVNERVDGTLSHSAYEYARDDDHPHWTTIATRTAGFATFRDTVLQEQTE